MADLSILRRMAETGATLRISHIGYVYLVGHQTGAVPTATEVYELANDGYLESVGEPWASPQDFMLTDKGREAAQEGGN